MSPVEMHLLIIRVKQPYSELNLVWFGLVRFTVRFPFPIPHLLPFNLDIRSGWSPILKLPIDMNHWTMNSGYIYYLVYMFSVKISYGQRLLLTQLHANTWSRRNEEAVKLNIPAFWVKLYSYVLFNPIFTGIGLNKHPPPRHFWHDIMK